MENWKVMSRRVICFLLLSAAFMSQACHWLGVPIVESEVKYVPAKPEGATFPDVPFKVLITEQRFNKTINWTLTPDGNLVSDYSKSGALAVTDWNTVKATVVSDNPSFKGVEIEAGGKCLIVRRDTQAPDSLKSFIITRNPDVREKTYDCTLTFTTGRNSCVLSVTAAEYIDITGVKVRHQSLEEWDSYYNRYTGQFLPTDWKYYYSGNDVVTYKFHNGYPTQSSGSSKGWYEIYYSVGSADLCYHTKTVFVEPVPLNTSWRLVGYEAGDHDASPEALAPLREEMARHPEFDHLDYNSYGVDWDEVMGKEICTVVGDGYIVPYVFPERDPKSKSGWKKTKAYSLFFSASGKIYRK